MKDKKLMLMTGGAFLLGVVVMYIVACLTLTTKIAIVDVQALVAKSSDVAALRQEQETKMKDLQTWLDTVRSEVEKQKNEKAKEELLAKYNQEFAQKQQEIRVDYAQKLKNIDDSLTAIIEEEANSLGYDIVASNGVILAGGVDITDAVAEKIK